MNLIDLINRDLNLSPGTVEDIVQNTRHLTKRIEIPKKDGTNRIVFQPNRKIKMIQVWLIKNFFEKIRVSQESAAYMHGASIKKNAEAHAGRNYLLRMDFQNFFPSICFSDLAARFQRESDEIFGSGVLDDRSLWMIEWACFDKGGRLVMGFPCSPILSNVAMIDFDQELSAELKSKADLIGTTVYTRYADDIVVSTDKKGACSKIEKLIAKFVAKRRSPRLKINLGKTCYMSSSGGSSVVTGLRIRKDGSLTLPKEIKDRIRLYLSLESKGKLAPKDKLRLSGYLNYAKYVDAEFFNKIQNKYFKEVAVMTS